MSCATHARTQPGGAFVHRLEKLTGETIEQAMKHERANKEYTSEQKH
jgi:hypothetical protein